MHQLRKLQARDAVASLFQITLVQEEQSPGGDVVMAKIDELIHELSSVFDEPKSLPPHRELDHEIHLVPNAAPVNVGPYRYPQFQKREIEKLVSEMLQAGII